MGLPKAIPEGSPMIRGGNRFPAFAKRLRPKADFGGQEPALASAKPPSAGEERPDKIMLN